MFLNKNKNRKRGEKMNMKKLILICGLALLLVGSVSTVSAGWFDFLEGNTTEHNFGNFSMNVPKNATFNETVEPNGLDAIKALAVKYFDGAVNITFADPKWKDPQYAEFLHPAWGNDQYSLVVEYINCSEDNITFDNVAEKLYPNSKEVNKTEDTAYYTYSDFNQTVSVKNHENKSLVIVRSNDTGLVNQMSDSLHFK